MTDTPSAPERPAEAAATLPKRNRKAMRAAAEQQAIARMADVAAMLAAQETARPVVPDVPTPAKQDMPAGAPTSVAEKRPASPPKSKPWAWWKERPKQSTSAALYGAALLLALGIGGLAGSRGFDTAAPAVRTADLDTALPWRRDKLMNGGSDASRLRDDVRMLRADIQTVRSNGEQARQLEAARFQQEARALRVALEGAKAETASLKADLAARIDRAEQGATQRNDKLVERIDRVEKRVADPIVTSAIQKPAAEPPKPEKADKPVQGFVLRDVSRGVALIETRRGMIEVAAGDMIPGAGRVQSIERHGGKWRVVTTNGTIDDQPD